MMDVNATGFSSLAALNPVLNRSIIHFKAKRCIAKVIFIVALVLFVLSAVFGARNRTYR